MKTIDSFADLKKVSKTLKQQARQKAQEVKKQRAHDIKVRRDADLFAKTMNAFGVRPLAADGRADTGKPKPNPLRRRNEQSDDDDQPPAPLSDLADTSLFISQDEGRLMHRPGISPEIPKKLYRGYWRIQAHIDLHGLTVDDARSEYLAFLQESQHRGYRCLKIIHGQGYNSAGGHGVLKTVINRWLKQTPEVMAFARAPLNKGGDGAVLVLLFA